MKLIILASLLFVGCGDDQQETEVNKIKKHETAEDVAERINADIQRVKDKVYQEGCLLYTSPSPRD